MFHTILIANRGEIACRIVRTCRRLGVRAVAVYSDADAQAQHVKLADTAIHIGGSRPAESYLLGERIIQAALDTGAQAIHPGFGFLSENADFADAVERAGLVFIGPRAASMRKMGSKAGAKALMRAANVPVVPGYEGAEQGNEHLFNKAQEVGFPLMIKAAHGGGGKGMRIVRTAAEFMDNLASCQREAKNAFGKDRVLLERYIETPRHIELQIFGDTHGQVFHLNERECSVQRRYQKILEESPSPFLTPALRTQMGAAAIQAGHAIDYVGAGTVEFIVSASGDFYFMEINTRLQVEHPVTEACLGLDLVEWQLRVAFGARLPWHQERMISHGHAIEVRIYAEDPESGFLPATGKLSTLRFPQSSARVDSGVAEGDVVSVFYDPMIAKLIVHAPDRLQAVAALKTALRDTDIGGIKSNIDFLEVLIRHADFMAAKIDTGYLDRALSDIYTPATLLPNDVLAAASALTLLENHTPNAADPHSPWQLGDAWRIGHAGKRVLAFDYRGTRVETHAHGNAAGFELSVGAQVLNVSDARLGDSATLSNVAMLTLKIDGRSLGVRVAKLGHGLSIHDGERRYLLSPQPAFAYVPTLAAKADAVRAPMPGRIVSVRTQVGSEVTEGAELLVMEAMKMELSLKAPRAGRVAELRASVGEFVEADAILARLD
jgi:3-methylcrotonyl-CoA carboxylase alpha subunit